MSTSFSYVRDSFIPADQAAILVTDLAIQRGYGIFDFCRQMPEAKTIDYLMAIWLQPYIRQHGADDPLYHQNGIISECPRSNFFIVTADNTLVTPARNILKGITRKKVLELAPAHIRTEERDITLADLPTARAAFITSTTKHILPVSHVDGHPIGSHPIGGQTHERVPGPISQWLNGQLYQLVQDIGHPITNQTAVE